MSSFLRRRAGALLLLLFVSGWSQRRVFWPERLLQQLLLLSREVL